MYMYVLALFQINSYTSVIYNVHIAIDIAMVGRYVGRFIVCQCRLRVLPLRVHMYIVQYTLYTLYIYIHTYYLLIGV